MISNTVWGNLDTPFLSWVISWKYKFVKKTSMPTSVESLGYIKCYSSSSPRPVKSPSNSIRQNCQKICGWSWRPKTILQIRKKATFLYMINNPITYKFVKDFANHRKKTNRAVVFSIELSPTFLNTGTTDETFQQSGKQDTFRHILKSSASMYESSGSQFFRTTTGVQLRPDAFDESRFIMTFLTILGVIEILCRFRLVLEGRTGKEILESSRLEFSDFQIKFLANNFVL